MGTRNAAVRKLAIPDLTTTVLTLTITGIGADSSLANGNNPRLARRVESVVAMFLGVRRWVRSSYTTRSQRLCGLRQRSPPCAVQRCFARCGRPVSCEGETRLYLTLQSATTVSNIVRNIRGRWSIHFLKFLPVLRARTPRKDRGSRPQAAGAQIGLSELRRVARQNKRSLN